MQVSGKAFRKGELPVSLIETICYQSVSNQAMMQLADLLEPILPWESSN
jgi:hypothetical protein